LRDNSPALAYALGRGICQFLFVARRFHEQVLGTFCFDGRLVSVDDVPIVGTGDANAYDDHATGEFLRRGQQQPRKYGPVE
jgi:hypothetical protein